MGYSVGMMADFQNGLEYLVLFGGFSCTEQL